LEDDLIYISCLGSNVKIDQIFSYCDDN